MTTFVDTTVLPPPTNNNLNASLSASVGRAKSSRARQLEEQEEEKRKRDARARRKKERAQKKAALEKERVDATLAEFDKKKKTVAYDRQNYLRNRIDLSHKMRKKKKELEEARQAEAMAAHQEKFEARWKLAAEADEDRKVKEKQEAIDNTLLKEDDNDTPLKRALLRANQFSHAASNARILAQQNQLEYARNTSLADVAAVAMARNKTKTTFGDESDEDERDAVNPFTLAEEQGKGKGKGKGKGHGSNVTRTARRRRRSEKPKVAEVHPGLACPVLPSTGTQGGLVYIYSV